MAADQDLDFSRMLDQLDEPEATGFGTPVAEPSKEAVDAFGLPGSTRTLIDGVVEAKRTDGEREAFIAENRKLLDLHKQRFLEQREKALGPQAKSIPPEDDAWFGELFRGVGRGAFGAKDMFGATLRQFATSERLHPGLMGGVPDEMEARGQGISDEAQKVMRQIPEPRVDSFTKIRTSAISEFARDLNDYAQQGLGQVIGHYGPMILGYGAAGVPGGLGVNFALSTGEVRKTFEEAGVTDPKLQEQYVWVAGMTVAALDSLVPHQLLTQEMRRGLGKYAITRIAKTINQIGLKEAATEAMQEMVQITAAANAAGIQIGEDGAGEQIYNMGKELHEKRWQIADAAALGYIAGKALGTPGAVKAELDGRRQDRLAGIAGSAAPMVQSGATIPDDTRTLAASQEGPTPRLEPGQSSVRGAKPAEPAIQDAERLLAEIGQGTIAQPSDVTPTPADASQGTPTTPEASQPVPTFSDAFAALPRDKAGDPDIAAFMEATGGRPYNQLTDAEKIAVVQSLRGEAPPAPATEAPAAVSAPAATTPAETPAAPPANLTEVVQRAVPQIEEAARVAAEQVVREQAVASLDEAARSRFSEVLGSKERRSNWGKASGLSEEQVRVLIDEAVADGRLTMRKGQPVRTAKARQAPASPQAEVARAATSVPMGRAAEVRLEGVKSDVAYKHAAAILGAGSSRESVLNRLAADKKATRAVLDEIHQAVTGKPSKSMRTKGAVIEALGKADAENIAQEADAGYFQQQAGATPTSEETSQVASEQGSETEQSASQRPPGDSYAIRSLQSIDDPVAREHARALIGSGTNVESAIGAMLADRRVSPEERQQIAEAYVGVPFTIDPVQAVRNAAAERGRDITSALLGGYVPEVSPSNLRIRDDIREQLVRMAERLPQGSALAIRDAIRIFEPSLGVMNLEGEVRWDGLKKILAVSLEYGPDVALRTFTHEEIHLLREMGVISDKQWAVLSGIANRRPKKEEAERLLKIRFDDGYLGHLTNAQYEALKKEAGKLTYRQIYQIDERYTHLKGNEAKLVEETVAHAAADWAQGREFAAPIERAFQKIRDFLEAIQNALHGLGFRSANDIFESIWAGELTRKFEEARERRFNTEAAMLDVMQEEGITAMAIGPVDPNAPIDGATGQSMRRDLDALGFYSGALEAAKSWNQKKGTPEQALMWLKKSGVKDAEIEATGLRTFLDGKQSVTREEVVGHLEGNRVRLKEVVKGDIKMSPDELHNYARNAGYADAEQIARARSMTVAALGEEAIESWGAPNPTKWSSYSLDPENPTYRETVLHLPETRVSEIDTRLDEINQEISRLSGGKDISPRDLPRFRELRAEAKSLSDERAELKRGNFRSGHFPEPNIIGHMMTSMTTHQGKPVYTIDQIQSDWGQRLRDDGVFDQNKIAQLDARQEQISKFLVTLQKDQGKFDRFEQIPFGFDAPLRDDAADMAKAWIAKDRGVDPDEEFGFNDPSDYIAVVKQELGRVQAELQTARAATPGNPLVNTTDQWVNTTLRRAIRQAAEANADYIAIPSGDTVLSYNPGDTEGMRGFYDGIVPKNLRNLLQKIDRATPAPEKVSTLDSPSGKTGLGKGFTLIALTDKVKQSVISEGQPMFAFAGEKAKTADLEALNAANDMESSGATRESIWHETGWFRGVDGRWRFEIDDSKSKLRVFGPPMSMLAVELTHDPLFDAYPELTDVEFNRDSSRVNSGAFQPGGILPSTITVSNRAKDRRSTALHEAQHALQDFEGFAEGGTPDDFVYQNQPLFQYRRSWENEVDAYRRLAGEVEARTVQKRMNYTADQREDRPPWLDYDVPEDQQIVRMPDGGPAVPRLSTGDGVSQKSYSAEPPISGHPTLAKPKMFAVRAFHGSPHDFNRFTMDAIGSGEGAQAFGFGLYFAESETVANFYREGLSAGARARQVLDDLGVASPAARDAIEAAQGDLDDAIFILRRDGVDQASIDAITRAKAEIEGAKAGGHLYEVSIDEDPAKFLDWDKPLGEQTPFVRNALGIDAFAAVDDGSILRSFAKAARKEDGSAPSIDLAYDAYAATAQNRGRAPMDFMGFERALLDAGFRVNRFAGANRVIGMQVDGVPEVSKRLASPAMMPRDFIRRTGTGKEQARFFKERGIPGVRYLDANSRNMMIGDKYAETGTSNIVVFDDSLVRITAKDGQPFIRQEIIDALKPDTADSQPMFALGPTPPQSTPEGESPGLNKIISDLKKTMGMTVSQGLWGFSVQQGNRSARVRPPSNVRGQFDRETGNVSLRQSRDIKTLAHEGGHYLESILGADLGAIKQRFAEALTGDPTPMPAALSEGFANWFRDYILDPQAAEARAPGMTEAFEELLEAERPDMLEGFDTIQQEYQRFITSAPIGEVAAGLSSQYDGTTWRELSKDAALDNISGKLSTMYQGAIDGGHVIKRGVSYLLKLADFNGIRDADGRPISLPAHENFYKLWRLFAGSYNRGRVWLDKGVSDLTTGRIIGPSLKSALEKALGDGRWNEKTYIDFNQYLVSIRALEEYNRLDEKKATVQQYDDTIARIADARQQLVTTGNRQQIAQLDAAAERLRREREATTKRGANRAPTAEPRAVHERVVRELGTPEFQEAAKLVHDFTFSLLEARRQAGFISQELFDELAKRKDWYVPFWRDMSDIEGAGAMFPGSGVKKWSMFKKFDGSDRSILMPLEVLSEEAYVTAQQIAFNDVVKAMVGLAERVGPGGGKIAERLARSETMEANAETFDKIKKMATDLGIDPVDAHMITQRMEMNFSDGDIKVILSPENLGPTAKPQLPMWENGERIMVRLPDPAFGRDMFEAINGLGKEMSDILVKSLALPAQMLRIGVTTHPDFIFRNIWRDIWTAWKTTGAAPFVSQYKGFKINSESGEVDGMSGEDFRRLYNEAGGIAGGINVNAQISDSRRDVKDLLDTNIDKKAVAAGAALGGFTGLAAGSSIGGLVGLMFGGPPGAAVGYKIGASIGGLVGGAGIGYAARHGEVWRAVESVETATRLGVAAHAYKRAKEHNPDLSDLEAMTEAAFVSRDIMDWNRRGSKMLAATRLVTFLNAQIQGLDRQFRQMTAQGDRGSVFRKQLENVFKHQQPGAILSRDEERDLADAYKSYLRWGAITLMLMGLAALSVDDDDYQDIKDQTKWTHSWFKSLGIWFRLPKPFELAVPSNIGEIIWDGSVGRDQRMAERIVDSMYEVLAPPGMPQAGRLAGGLLFNRDRQGIFSGRSREIVGDNLASRPPHERYSAFTSEFAIDLSRAMYLAGVPQSLIPAPVKTDFVLSAAGAYWGREVQNSYQTAKTMVGMSTRPDRKATDFPILRGFTGEAARMSRSVSDMWSMISREGGEMTVAANEYKRLLDDRGRPAEAETWLAQLEPEQRIWALTQYYGSRSDKREHPLQRADQAVRINNEIMTEMIRDLLAPKVRQGRKQVRDFEEIIELTPAKKMEVQDILLRLSQIEARNTMILMKRRGFEGLEIKDPQLIIDELKAADREVHDLLLERRDKKVADWPDVLHEWPKYKERVLREGVNAF